VPRWNENRFSKKKDVPRWNEDQFDGLDSMEGDANLIDNDAAPLFNKRVNRLTAANAALKDMKMTIEVFNFYLVSLYTAREFFWYYRVVVGMVKNSKIIDLLPDE